MIKIGKVQLGQRPRIAVSLWDYHKKLDIQKAIRLGVSVVEIRADLFKRTNLDTLTAFAKKIGATPKIFTLRSLKEGGSCRLKDQERLILFRQMALCVQAVDIELSSKGILSDVVGHYRRLKKTVIISYHDFKHTPSNAVLEKVLKTAKKAKADIVKIACMAESAEDVTRMARFTVKHANSGLITIAMGKEGMVSRVLFPFLGSLLSFAHIGKASAPGQIPLRALGKLR